MHVNGQGVAFELFRLFHCDAWLISHGRRRRRHTSARMALCMCGCASIDRTPWARNSAPRSVGTHKHATFLEQFHFRAASPMRAPAIGMQRCCMHLDVEAHVPTPGTSALTHLKAGNSTTCLFQRSSFSGEVFNSLLRPFSWEDTQLHPQ